jgi:hypothetical protein
MNTNRWACITKFLQISVLASTLLLSSLSAITSLAVSPTKSPKCSRHPQLCTPAPMLIATPPPNTVPTSQVQPHPTHGMLPASTPTAGTSLAATPASAMATAVPIAANQRTKRTDATATNQQSQGRADQGFPLFLLSLGVGVALFLLSGAMLWLMWRRQTDQRQPVLQGMSYHARAPRWMNSRRIQLSPDASQYALSAVFASGVSERTLPLGSTEPVSSPQLGSPPSTPGLMRTAFPQHLLRIASNNAARSLSNGDLESRPTASLNLPVQPTEAGASNHNGHTLPPVPPSTALVETPTTSLPSSHSLSPVLPAAVRPPFIKDDPVLEAIMRQAQMGLFVLLGRESTTTLRTP